MKKTLKVFSMLFAMFMVSGCFGGGSNNPSNENESSVETSENQTSESQSSVALSEVQAKATLHQAANPLVLS